MCVFSIGGHTVGPTVLKFGMEDHIYPWEVIGYISFRYPNPQGRGRPKSGSGCLSIGDPPIKMLKMHRAKPGTPAS